MILLLWPRYTHFDVFCRALSLGQHSDPAKHLKINIMKKSERVLTELNAHTTYFDQVVYRRFEFLTVARQDFQQVQKIYEMFIAQAVVETLHTFFKQLIGPYSYVRPFNTKKCIRVTFIEHKIEIVQYLKYHQMVYLPCFSIEYVNFYQTCIDEIKWKLRFDLHNICLH